MENGADAHMHIGGIGIFEGPSLPEGVLFDHIASRLQLVPRFRQKLAFPPLNTGRPLWVDDPRFKLDYHVRRTALPSPGSDEQLYRLVSRVFSQRLDRTKPLWEIWIVEGLAEGRWGFVTKTHHALVDGVGGIDILTALLDLTREAPEIPPDNWVPRREPSNLDMLRRGMAGIVRNATDIAEDAIRGVAQPKETVGEVTERALGVAELLHAYAFPAPQTPLNRKPGPHRNFAVVPEPLTKYKEIRRTLSGTLNDVVLTVVAGGLRRLLADHGVAVDELAVRCLVPMSIRTKEGQGAAGNQIVVLVARLFVDVADPVERLARTHAEMERHKAGRQAVGARTMTQMESFAPPNVLAQAARLGFSSRLYNLLITNVPGPQFPVYLRGRKMLAAYPVAFLAPEHTLAVAVLSYDGHITISLIGDADALPDIDKLADHIDASLHELLAAAQASVPGPGKPRGSDSSLSHGMRKQQNSRQVSHPYPGQSRDDGARDSRISRR